MHNSPAPPFSSADTIPFSSADTIMLDDPLNAVRAWSAEGQPCALATVVRTWGSAPRPIGAKLAVRGDGAMVGSVSGGCVEGAVIEAARDVMHSGTPQKLEFGVADETAWSVGLACGGSIEIWVEAITS